MLKELSEIVGVPETFELLKYCLGFSTPYSFLNPIKLDSAKSLDKHVSILAKNERLSPAEALTLSNQIRENIGKGDLYEVQFFDPKWGSTGFTIELGHPFEYVRSNVHCIITQTGKRGLQSYSGHIGPSMFDAAYAAIDFIEPKLAKKAIGGSIEALDEVRSLVEMAKCKCAMILDISRSYIPIYVTDGSNFAYKVHPSKFYRSIPFIEIEMLSVEKMFDEITSIVDRSHKSPASIRGPTLAEWSHTWVNPQRRRKRTCLEPRVINPKESTASCAAAVNAEMTPAIGGDRKRLKTPTGSTPVNHPEFGLESPAAVETVTPSSTPVSEKDEAELISKEEKKRALKAERDEAKEKARLEKEEAKLLLMEEKKKVIEEKAAEKKRLQEEKLAEKKRLQEEKAAEKKRLQEEAKDRSKKEKNKDKELKELKDIRSKIDDEAAARIKTMELLKDLEATKKKIAEQEEQQNKKGYLPASSDVSSSISSSASTSSSSSSDDDDSSS